MITYELIITIKPEAINKLSPLQRKKDLGRIGAAKLSFQKRWVAESTAHEISDLWWVERAVINRIDRKHHKTYEGCHDLKCAEHSVKKEA